MKSFKKREIEIYIWGQKERIILESTTNIGWSSGVFKCGDDIVHKDDGYAYKNGDMKVWFNKGKIHRVGGPAIIMMGGSEEEYFLNGRRYDKKEYIKLTRHIKINEILNDK